MSVSLLVDTVLVSAIVRYEQSQVSRGTTQPLEPGAPWPRGTAQAALELGASVVALHNP